MPEYGTDTPTAHREQDSNWRSIGDLARELVDRASTKPKEAAE